MCYFSVGLVAEPFSALNGFECIAHEGVILSVKKRVTVFCDGSCLNSGKKDSPGGWAYAEIDEEQKLIKSMSGGETETTNNRMELLAVINAIEHTESSHILIKTDSMYVINPPTKGWLKRWQQSDFRSGGKPVKNVDLWERFVKASREKHIEFEWVKGHSGNRWNEFVDGLAKSEWQK